MKRALYIALASALITTAAIKAAPARAEPAAAAEMNVRLVRTADLDLTSDTGRRQLDRRLAAAARQVCGVASDVDVEGKNAVRKCRDEIVAKAKAQREAIVAARGGVIALTAGR